MARAPSTDVLMRSEDIPWIPQGSEGVFFKPLRISLQEGSWVNLLRVERNGVVNRHRHRSAVEGWVVRGAWRYAEHDWRAGPGDYVYEPPGDTHTLIADVGKDRDPMMTLFFIHGPIGYLDEQGGHLFTETAETKLRRYHDHCARLGRSPIPVEF